MSPPAPSARRTDPRVTRSRDAVLAAAVELLAERGVAATTIEAVAARSGVAKTTIYRQWADQTSLVRDAFAGTLGGPPVPDTGTLRGDLLELVDGLADAVSSGPAASIMVGLMDAAERDPAFAELHRREATDRHRVVRDVIERGIRRGEVGAGADPVLALDLLAGPIFHRRWITHRPVDGALAVAVVDAALTVLRAGAPPAQPPAEPGQGDAPARG